MKKAELKVLICFFCKINEHITYLDSSFNVFIFCFS